MKRLRPLFPGIALALALGVAATSAATSPRHPLGAHGAARARAGDLPRATGLTIRWDVASYNFSAAPVSVSAGGRASARASDGSRITFTGSGTFGGSPGGVTGGGAWTTVDPQGNVTGSGTYEVKALVSFVGAPGTFGEATGKYLLIDQIGDSADAHAGLAVLRIAYSDGSPGSLVVGSRLVGTPPPVFVGITATKGFVAYWQREAPAAGKNANRALFHLVR